MANRFAIIPDDELPDCDPDADLGASPDDFGLKKNILQKQFVTFKRKLSRVSTKIIDPFQNMFHVFRFFANTLLTLIVQTKFQMISTNQ